MLTLQGWIVSYVQDVTIWTSEKITTSLSTEDFAPFNSSMTDTWSRNSTRWKPLPTLKLTTCLKTIQQDSSAYLALLIPSSCWLLSYSIQPTHSHWGNFCIQIFFFDNLAFQCWNKAVYSLWGVIGTLAELSFNIHVGWNFTFHALSFELQFWFTAMQCANFEIFQRRYGIKQHDPCELYLHNRRQNSGHNLRWERGQESSTWSEKHTPQTQDCHPHQQEERQGHVLLLLSLLSWPLPSRNEELFYAETVSTSS